MTTTTPEARPVAGTLQSTARGFADALKAGEDAQAQEMLAAWSDAYWGTRADLDALMERIREARAAGESFSPSWLSRERRLKAVLATAKAELDRYAKAGARAATRAQEQALKAAQANARKLATKALDTNLPGLDVGLAAINPANLEISVGLLGDGTPLARHMVDRVGGQDALDALKNVLTQGLTQGWSQDKMVRAFTQQFAVPHTRAVTIMRTESLRVYRETSRATYQANSQVIGSWTWECALDRASCAACVAMHGTRHPVTETLDGHPRCRCAMIPNTKTWAELGLPGIPDTNVTLEKGTDWFKRQPAAYQRGLLGRQKYAALQRGEIDLPDLVARKYDPDWGTMRTERSLKSIRQNRNANWNTLDEPPPATPATPKPAPKAPGPSDLEYQRALMRQHDEQFLRDVVNDPAVDPVRRQAAQAELEDRAKGATDLPSDLAPSKFPPSELRRFRDQLRTMDDDKVRAQFRQRDKGAADLARREWDDRLGRMDPKDIPTEDLDRALELAKASPDVMRRLDVFSEQQARAEAARNAAFRPPWKGMEPESGEQIIGATGTTTRAGRNGSSANPRYGEGTEWQHNCTNCATTYELRRRGYDVTAQSRSRGRPATETPAAWGYNMLDFFESKRTWLQTEKWALSQGEGARGAVSMAWKGGGGHIFNWEVIGGRVRWFDAQPGLEYELAWLRRQAKAHAYAFRLDDRDITEALNDYLLGHSTDPTGPH